MNGETAGVAVGDRVEIVGRRHDGIDRGWLPRFDGTGGVVARTWSNGNRRMARVEFGGRADGSCVVRVAALRKVAGS